MLSSAPHASETERLAQLAELTNGATFDRLASFGSLDGMCCIDIGAGDGSVARWLAERVGRRGRVVATDLDGDRFRPSPAVEWRRFDFAHDELESDTYNLVHARSVLLHVADPVGALERMAGALRPGGVLLVEDSDLTSFAACDPDHPLAAEFDAGMRAFHESLAAVGVHTKLGPRLPAFVSALGLDDVDCAARLVMLRGGSAGAALWKRNVANVLPASSHVIVAFEDQAFWCASTLRVQVWGRQAVSKRENDKGAL